MYRQGVEIDIPPGRGLYKCRGVFTTHAARNPHIVAAAKHAPIQEPEKGAGWLEFMITIKDYRD
jgi:hypothetical protein